MRCFIAIDFPEHVKRTISELLLTVSHKDRGIRWTPPENMHLTLKFLGEVKDETAEDIQNSLSSICANLKPFSIAIRGTGAFPNFRSPNVLWIGIETSPELQGLFRAIDKTMTSLGFEPEGRRFSPHLTVGRVRDKRGIEQVVKTFAESREAIFGTAEVSEVLLMKSLLKPSGTEYSIVAAAKLAGR